MLSLFPFPRGVLDEILNLIGSVSEDFPSYSSAGASCRFHTTSLPLSAFHGRDTFEKAIKPQLSTDLFFAAW